MPGKRVGCKEPLQREAMRTAQEEKANEEDK